MKQTKERPSLFVGWVHKGKKEFEVIPESKYKSLLEYLFFKKGVHPGAVFISKMTICHWIDADYHKGNKQVNIYDFYNQLEEIKEPKCEYKQLLLKSTSKRESPNYGYISPDGRYFRCDYFGHSSLEREIVGNLEEINDPQQYLYDRGWLCIYHDPFNKGTYAIAMGHKKHMTNEQLHMLDVLKIPHNSHRFQDYLLGED